MAPITQKRHGYRIEKNIDDNVYLVSREADNEQFLGTKWDASTVSQPFSDLLERGTKGALGSLLNHPNLINYTDTVADNVVCGRGTATTVSAQRMLLWDFCEAGTLQNLFRHHPVLPKTAAPHSQVVTQFLPEGLCWHVLLSVLRALSWLHEGHRDDSSITGPHGRRKQHDWFSDPDWLPILHRNIRPEHIFFKHPKGTESYGLCKLGNYSSCFVSGHVNSNFTGQVVAASQGDESLTALRAHLNGDVSSLEPVSQVKSSSTRYGRCWFGGRSGTDQLRRRRAGQTAIHQGHGALPAGADCVPDDVDEGGAGPGGPRGRLATGV
jgi:serine/threonine protein kinase